MRRRWERLRRWWKLTWCQHEWVSLRFTRDGLYLEQRCRGCGMERKSLRKVLKVKRGDRA